jgi:methionyl-tRNA formyltransferase
MNESRRIIFFGTGAYFSCIALKRLVELGFPPNAIVVPEYPSASNTPSLDNITLQVTTSQNPLIKIGEEAGVPIVFAPEKNDSTLARELAVYDPEFILVVCWPYLLSEEVCSVASKAALNLHPSLLPKYRGANPVEDQVRVGETKLGVSLHLLSQAFDAGDIIKQCELDLSDKKINAQQIEKQAARVGIDSFVESMNEFDGDKWRPQRQRSFRKR